jgi:hypothetical protein
MAGHLRAVSDEDAPADPISEAEGAKEIAEFIHKMAGRMPVGSTVRSYALTQADRWFTMATLSTPVDLSTPPGWPLP